MVPDPLVTHGADLIPYDSGVANHLSPTEVREHQAHGVRLTGSLEEIAVKLKQVKSFYSWDNPADAGVQLQFLEPIPWKGNASTCQGLTRLELEAVKWWLEKTRFTALHGTARDGYSYRSCQTTYVEMAIALELETRVHLGGPSADLSRKVALLRTALRFLMQNCSPRSSEARRRKKDPFYIFFVQKKVHRLVRAHCWSPPRWYLPW